MMNQVSPSLVKIFDRDLSKLEEEINHYPTEESMWTVAGDIKNSGGNLCLHLCGNLRHFIGTQLGKTGYVRNRDYEFSAKNVARQDLIAEIQQTKKDIASTLSNLDPSVLAAEYPIQVFGYPMDTTFFLIHLAAHLDYHLGQVNYHRRLLS